MSFCVTIVGFDVVLAFLWPSQSKEAASPGLAIGLVLLGATAGIAPADSSRNRSCAPMTAAWRGYRPRFFLRIAFAQTAALFGFVGCLIALVTAAISPCGNVERCEQLASRIRGDCEGREAIRRSGVARTGAASGGQASTFTKRGPAGPGACGKPLDGLLPNGIPCGQVRRRHRSRWLRSGRLVGKGGTGRRPKRADQQQCPGTGSPLGGSTAERRPTGRGAGRRPKRADQQQCPGTGSPLGRSTAERRPTGRGGGFRSQRQR
jgi:F0F1-type ATP synthase membrane subunit c/vacuolar-type H+-ATPase subunit K